MVKTNRKVKEIYNIVQPMGNIKFKTSNKEVVKKYQQRKLAASKTAFGDRYPINITKLEVKQ